RPAYTSPKCDVLIASFDAAVLRTTGVEILQILWAHNVSAELAKDSRSPEDLLSKYRDDSYSWVVIIKQDAMLKVKSLGKKDVPDVDIAMAQLLSWLRAEIRERDSKAVVKLRGNQQAEAAAAAENHVEQDVRVLVAQTKSKKFNRRTVVEQAQVSASSLVQSFLDGPILAVETADQVMDLIRATSLSDGESWRKVEHTVTTAEKKYVREIHDMLSNWQWAWEKKSGSRHAYGSVEVMADLLDGTHAGRERQFFDVLNESNDPDVLKPLMHDALSMLVNTYEVVESVDRFSFLDFELSAHQWSQVESFYDVWDCLAWDESMTWQEIKDDTKMTVFREMGEIMTVLLDGDCPDTIDIPEVWYPERYLEARKEDARAIQEQLAWALARLYDATALEHEYKNWDDPVTHKQHDRRELLVQAVEQYEGFV
ncbi:hypothetical protein BN1723_016794, partial [Verticillium longisporum]